MLTLDAPTPLVGNLLEQELADVGLVTPVALSGAALTLADLDESHRPAAQAVVDAHGPRAQAFLDAAAAEYANETTIRDRALQALAANRSDIANCDTILGLPATLTNAQRDSAIKELARQSKTQAQALNGLLRLVLRRFDGTD